MKHPTPWDLRLQAIALAVIALAAIAFFAPGLMTRDGAVQAATPPAVPRAIEPRGALAPDEQANIRIFDTWKSSVVFISTSERVTDFWTRDVRTVPRGTGSGFIWDADGHVVTNVHVIEGAAEATVKLADGRDYPASLVGASRTHDLAVLKISVPANQPRPVAIGTSHDLRVGQKVYAIGNPFGLDWTLTTGIVSALDRSLDEEEGTVIRHLIQTDAAINPGNSGGVLLDSAGRLIGVNTAIYSPSGASAGVGFAVPVDTVNRVVPQLIALGHYTPRSLGIEADDSLSGAIERQLGVSGVAVLRAGGANRNVLRGAKLGARNTIVPGDVILSVNGTRVQSSAALAAVLDDFDIGQTVRLRIWREGHELDVNAVLAAGEEG